MTTSPEKAITARVANRVEEIGEGYQRQKRLDTLTAEFATATSRAEASGAALRRTEETFPEGAPERTVAFARHRGDCARLRGAEASLRLEVVAHEKVTASDEWLAWETEADTIEMGNPYPSFTPENDAWCDGYEAGELGNSGYMSEANEGHALAVYGSRLPLYREGYAAARAAVS